MIPKIKVFNPKFHNPKFTVCSIIVLTGAVFENEQEKGISHFIEHLIFQGSPYFPEMQNLTSSINSLGMSINAYTNYFVTVYHITSLTSNIKDAIDNLVKMVFNPSFNEKDINEERKVVINEILERKSSPEEFCWEESIKYIFQKENPLHYTVGGPEETVKKITRDNILTYYNKYYQPKNIVFVSITNKDKEQTKKIWENAYEKYSNQPNSDNNSFPSSMEIFKSIQPKLALINRPKSIVLEKKFKKLDTYYTIISYLAKRPSPKNIYALKIFANYLAGSLSSVLFLELREKKQLIYSISSSVSYDNNFISIVLDFNCKRNNNDLNECQKIIEKIIHQSMDSGIPNKEFKKFKHKLIVSIEKKKGASNYELNKFIDEKLFGLFLDNINIVKNITNSFLHKSIQEFFTNNNKYIMVV